MEKEKKNKSRIQEGMLNRYLRIYLAILLFALLIVVKLGKTTIIDAPHWNEKARQSLLGGDTIIPERGKILAADGSILAVSVRYYQVRLDLRSPRFKDKEFLPEIDNLCKRLAAFHTQPKRTAEQWKAQFQKE